MGTGNYTDEFKRDAVAQITERGYLVAEMAKRLGGQSALPLRMAKKVLKAIRVN